MTESTVSLQIVGDLLDVEKHTKTNPSCVLKQLAQKRCALDSKKAPKHQFWNQLRLNDELSSALPVHKSSAKATEAVISTRQKKPFVVKLVDGQLKNSGQQPNGISITTDDNETVRQAWYAYLQALPEQELTAAMTFLMPQTPSIKIHITSDIEVKIHHQLVENGAKGLNLNIIVDSGVRASVTEQIVTKDQSTHSYWVNRDLHIARHAHLQNNGIVHLGQNVALLQSSRAQVAQSGVYACYHVVSGGRYFRHFQQVHLQERKARYLLIGLGLGAGKGCYDHNVLVKHEASDTYSEQICPQVLREQAISNFMSRVQVCAEVANIQSSQLNHNLLLDPTARALTAPELEIYADAVECAHGATVGAIDEAAVFYLRARGLSQKAAESLLVSGFLQSVISKIPEQHQDNAQSLVHDYLNAMR